MNCLPLSPLKMWNLNLKPFQKLNFFDNSSSHVALDPLLIFPETPLAQILQIAHVQVIAAPEAPNADHIIPPEVVVEPV